MSLSSFRSRQVRACWMELNDRGRLGGDWLSSSDDCEFLPGAEELAGGDDGGEDPVAAAGVGAPSAGAATGGA